MIKNLHEIGYVSYRSKRLDNFSFEIGLFDDRKQK
jgi:hypothetical protein